MVEFNEMDFKGDEGFALMIGECCKSVICFLAPPPRPALFFFSVTGGTIVSTSLVFLGVDKDEDLNFLCGN